MEEVITKFRLLSNQAGYVNTTTSDHAHLIEKLQMILNPSLVKRVMLLNDVPETIDKWATRAIQIDTNYRQTMEMMERIAGEKKNSKPSTSKGNMNKWNKKKEEKDPDAMDVDGMSDGKQAFLMRKRGLALNVKNPAIWPETARKTKEGREKERSLSRRI